MNVQQLATHTLYGIEIRTSNHSPKDIIALWERFKTQQIADDIPERADDKIIAAYHTYEHDHTRPYTYFLGCEVIDVACAPDGFVLREIPAGKYAEFNVKGPMPQALMIAWQQIWESTLRRTYAVDFEVYDPKLSDEVTIYVGVH